MPLEHIIVPNAIIPALRVNNKKQALQELSEKAAEISGLPAREIFDAWLQREKLNSTGLGDGIAIPHGRLLTADHIFGLFARLERPIDFESLDNQPVDIIFGLIAPESAGADHLKALATIARVLRNPATVAKIRATREPSALYSLLIRPSRSSDAA
ncbi:PTS system nitrogen regulatory IIA component [Rhodoblastus acidophilus]|uniref:PTS sugar transporter subunit IIA n=1 Tax=Rhodoblastus acidophilus TaxID=1074 RepID=UPI001609B707|nr:PTS sugar transporter subunit IIA [Rhodoblastus acidophilus]MCW2285203.1 PTS system nitrogen regulatory IIA component [Rhodoblastus acidophilus]MCW2334159.1 PTS system nitrogen regulatory IIA component [Rhodoblastus acidophilus]